MKRTKVIEKIAKVESIPLHDGHNGMHNFLDKERHRGRESDCE